MRRNVVFTAVAFTGVILFLIYNLFTLITLLFDDGSFDAIRAVDVPAPGSAKIDTRPQLIPKIIHQTYINTTIPAQWREAQKSCIELHSDYEYKLWTDATSREFIEKEYPWFLSTFDGYPYNIMRADTIRYFVLAHHGGIYIDLDDGCNRRLDPLLSYPAWVRKTIPTGISNDAMGAVPAHPFFLRVIETLGSHDRNWKVPYITVMASTGPLFLSIIWKEYTRWRTPELADADRVRILMPAEYKGHAWSFFNVYKGSSWHSGDARTIFWMGQHWLFLTIAGFSLAGFIFATIYYTYLRKDTGMSRLRISRRKWFPWQRRYTKINPVEDGHELSPHTA